jgi:hypothetical protein
MPVSNPPPDKNPYREDEYVHDDLDAFPGEELAFDEAGRKYELVTVATYLYLYQAQAAHLFLSQAGVQSFIADAEVVAMDWLLSNAIGGVKLRVPRDQAEEAVEVLTRGHKPESTSSDEIDDPQVSQEASSLEEDDGWTAFKCLVCGTEILESESKCPECGWSYEAETDRDSG